VSKIAKSRRMVNSTNSSNKGEKSSVSQEVKKRLSKRDIYVGSVTIVATIAICVVAIYYKDELMGIANMAGYSLLGVLILSFIAGSVFSFTLVPVPYWLLTFTLPSVLAAKFGIWAPLWVGMTSALGCTLGHLPTFMIGYGGGRLSKGVTTKINNRLYNKVTEWARRHGSWTSFLMSAMFNPFHLPMTIAIGALHYPLPKFFLFSFLGNAVKSLFLAFAGYFGLTSLLHFIGA
jgi:membrane protein DedA with SNARE-associated domain